MNEPDVPRRTSEPQPSPARQRLAAMIEKLEFGCIDELHLLNGEPQFTPRPRLKRVFNLAANDGSSAKRRGREYRLRTLRALFDRLNSIRGAVVVSILVQHGVPVRLTVYDPEEA